MPETVRTLAWHGSQLILGTQRHYCALTAQQGAASGTSTHTELAEIFPLGAGKGGTAAAPCLKALPRSAEVLLLLDSLGVVTSMRGQPSGSSIAFASAPLQLAQVRLCRCYRFSPYRFQFKGNLVWDLPNLSAPWLMSFNA
jgi:hypothetical protein